MTTKGYQVNIIALPEKDGGGYLAIVPELPGCVIDGDTPEEALQAIQGAIEAWISIEKEAGNEIPEPKGYRPQSEYSGRLGLRLPKWMHARIAQAAEEEDCSINQYIQNAIAYSLGITFIFVLKSNSRLLHHITHRAKQKRIRLIGLTIFSKSRPVRVLSANKRGQDDSAQKNQPSTIHTHGISSDRLQFQANTVTKASSRLPGFFSKQL